MIVFSLRPAEFWDLGSQKKTNQIWAKFLFPLDKDSFFTNQHETFQLRVLPSYSECYPLTISTTLLQGWADKFAQVSNGC